MIVALVAGLGGFWLLLTALVRHEKGRVGISDSRRVYLRFTGRLVLMADEIARALTPAFRQMAEAGRRWHVTFDTSPLVRLEDEVEDA